MNNKVTYVDNDKFQQHKNEEFRFGKIFKGFAFCTVLVVGGSFYNYCTIDQLYDSIERDTVNKVRSDYISYNYENNIQLENPITAYDEMVSSVAEFYKNGLKLYNPDQVFMFYCYMKDGGYFSVDRTYDYGLPNIDVFGKRGINIILGSGVCEHEASFFKDILDEMGFENYRINCSIDIVGGEDFVGSINEGNGFIGTNTTTSVDVDVNDLSTISHSSLHNRIKEMSILPWIKLFAGDEDATHTFNAVHYEDSMYYYDTTNFVKWKYLGDKKWESIPINYSSDVSVIADFMPVSTKMSNDIGNVLDYPSDNDVSYCQIMNDAFVMGDYDMLLDTWYDCIPEDLFNSIKTLENYKQMRR